MKPKDRLLLIRTQGLKYISLFVNRKTNNEIYKAFTSHDASFQVHLIYSDSV